MMRRLARRSAFLLLVLLCVSSVALAQSTTDGAIGGTVTDSSGSVVPGASVTTTNLGTANTSSGKTDSSGRYLIFHLQPGSYSLEISAQGLATFKQTNIIVEVGRLTSIDTTLGVAGQTTTVEVTGEAPVITTDRPEITTNINQTTIDNLPVSGRRWSTFALGTPGATGDGNFGLVSFRGISGLLNNNTVDGADNNQAFFAEERGRTRMSYSTSEASIQEFQVNTSNYSAEYGRAAGGVVNAVTKSGTNSIHGQAFWFDRSSDWGAINVFVTKKVRVNNVLTTVPFLPENKRHQFGGGIGGPIIKDKLFFFFSADQQLQLFPAVGNSGTPGAIFAPITVVAPSGGNTCSTAFNNLSEGNVLSCRGFSQAQVNSVTTFLASLTGNVPRRADELVLLPKIDWNINSKNRASFTYNRLRWNSPEGIQTQAVVFRGIESFGGDFAKIDWGVARWISEFSSAITNELRYQIGREFQFEFSDAPITGEPVSAQGTSPQITVNGVGGFVFGKPNFLDRPAFPKETRNQIADTLAWSHGTHLFKFGFDFNHVHDINNNLFTGAGAYSYNNRVDYISDSLNFVNNLPLVCNAGDKFATAAAAGTTPVPCFNNFSQEIGPTTFTFNTNDLAFFAQDDWRIRPRLTINLGLRWDTEFMPSPQVPNPALPLTRVFPSDRHDFGPRVGFAYDLTGRGKMVVRGGYGIFYGRIINSTISNAISNNANPVGTQLSLFFPQGAMGEPTYPKVFPPNTVVAIGALQAVQFAPNTRLPQVQEYDASWEWEVAANTGVSVSYIGSQGRRLPRFVDTNLNTPTLATTYNFVGGPFAGQSITVPFFSEPKGTNAGRTNQSFGAITDISYSVNSHYNALVVALNRRFYRTFQIQAGYTYAHANDGGQGSQTFSATNNVLNPLNFALENSRSTFDVRHSFGFSAIWEPNPYKGDSTWMKELVNGFEISPVVSASSGAPFTGMVSGTAPSQTIGGVTNVAVSSGILGAGGTNRLPNVPLNAFQLPRVVNVDLRIGKSFTIREGIKFTLTGDAFNLFNHLNVTGVNTLEYAISGNTLTFQDGTGGSHGSSRFAVPNTSSNTLFPHLGQRQIQIGAKLNF